MKNCATHPLPRDGTFLPGESFQPAHGEGGNPNRTQRSHTAEETQIKVARIHGAVFGEKRTIPRAPHTISGDPSSLLISTEQEIHVQKLLGRSYPRKTGRKIPRAYAGPRITCIS